MCNANVFAILFCLIVSGYTSVEAGEFVVYDGSRLTDGYDMGVNSSGGNTTWLKDEGNQFKLSYPAQQTWGAVFVTVGKPVAPGARDWKNFKSFDSLFIEMKGQDGGEAVEIGVKDNSDPDNGSETKKKISLTKDYETYGFALEEFKTADYEKLYVVAQFVFTGADSRTIFVRKIAYR